MDTQSSISVSVILPVRNEAKSLPALLTSLLQQDFPANRFEIIVADGVSTDNTRDIVRNFASKSPVTITLVDNPGIRSGPGRNAGVGVARGEYILFIDGHCHIPSTQLLRDTILLFKQTQADCLCRPQPLLAPTKSGFGAAVAAVRASVLGHGRDSLIYDMTRSGFVDPASSGAAYRRSVFTKLGAYDQSFDACEDVEFNTRVRKSGMSAYTDPRLAVFYEPRSSLSSLIRQMLRYGRGRAKLVFKHPDCASPGQLAPPLLTLWIAGALLASVSPIHIAAWVRWTLFAPIALYLVSMLFSSLFLARKLAGRIFYHAPAIYLAIHIGLGIGIWTETIRRVALLFTQRSSLRTMGSSLLKLSRMLANKMLQMEPRA
jgi:glycosyltransferase involved in cell wall biosynthesis